MYKLEFGIVHRGCLVNELSRALPKIRLICPGGFILSRSSVEEVVVLDSVNEQDLASVLGYLQSSPGIAEVEVLEQLPQQAFVRILASKTPETFCSEAVAKHHCFRIGMEIQQGGVEQWKVGCRHRSQAEALVEELKTMGELKYHSIAEASWKALLGENGA